ncbi:PREDICTED: ribosomal protein S6 kinase-like 1 [Bison bison bison]|uniref:non-specific serine/threonine protein kinase n=1 Tax=Bison bison bison TaxID=43346 RepID=A0A6P3IQY5_BISBB|nr:PREDICTED: ribosomal protein S6 kinase-like 1 [Bison bison bison]
MSLVACECPPGPGPEPEPCSRARSQARVYLEQIRNRVAPGAPDMTKHDYLVDAASQIRLALERDVSEDYEAAFNHYQNGVDVLLRGMHVDPNKERCEAVKLKITKYLRRAEEIFNCHLQRTLGSGASPDEGFSSLRLRPIRTLSSALEQLRGCKVVGVIEKVQLVQDLATGGTFVVKGLSRCHVTSRERLTIIPHGVPYMTQLLRYFVTEDSIFLHLEHVKGGTLWSHLLSQPCPQQSGTGSGSSLERMKAPLNSHLSLGTSSVPLGYTRLQDGIPLEPPWTSQSLTPARGVASVKAQREAGGEASARTSTARVLCRDLNPRNLLLDQAGHIRLTYFGQWSEVEPQCCREASHNLYSAPEVGGISELTDACDWWSFGSLLYELLTGTALSQSHPSGIQPHTQLQLPEWLSGPAASLLTELLQFDPARRLGAGGGGVHELKAHPFFSSIQWS